MAKTAPKHTLDERLETIRTQLAELRQTEALEAQVHDMVMAKRSRVDGLMAEFLSLAAESAVLDPRPAAVEARPVEAEAPPQAAPLPPPMPLTTLPPAGAPRDLLQTNGNGAAPTPSAQQVLDSLNRLMSGLKEISAKQSNAAIVLNG